MLKSNPLNYFLFFLLGATIGVSLPAARAYITADWDRLDTGMGMTRFAEAERVDMYLYDLNLRLRRLESVRNAKAK